MLPRGLKLFYANWIDDDTGCLYAARVVGRTYDSAFKRWYKEAYNCFYRFYYYFHEIDDKERISQFVEEYGIENIKAGIYDW